MHYTFILLAVIGVACSTKYASEDELKMYVSDKNNGLRKSVVQNGIELEAIYKPCDLIVAQQLQYASSSKEKENILKEVDSTEYFVLRLSRNGEELENTYAGNPALANHISNYLSYDIGNSLHLTQDGNITNAFDVSYTRTYGASNATSVLIAFNKKIDERGGDIKLSLDDKVLGIGSVNFDFKISNINNRPTLKFN